MTREPASIPSSPWKIADSTNATNHLDDSTLQTKHEFYYSAGIQEGLRRREDELALVRSQRDTTALEAVNMRAKIRELEQKLEHHETSQKHAVSTSPSDASFTHSFVRISTSPTTSNEHSLSVSPSPHHSPTSTNYRHGIPSYRSAFPTREAEIALRGLMEKAKAMDSRALTRIKSLCKEAHATPRDEKSWAQKFVLSEWRNPPELATPSSLNRDPTRPLLPNPRMGDSFESWYEYYCIHNSSLPRGVRKDTFGRPWKPDLRASRIAAQLRPAQGCQPATRTEFTVSLMELLDTPGEYQRIVIERGFSVASEVTLSPYEGPASVTVEDVVRHMAGCGITFQMIRDDLEPWSHQYKSVAPSPASVRNA
uniref:Uncharacterized protein n=1 Tax=Moniliophthora roreri TaxID=221103 RepID=A0A0W0FJ20_MONRR